MTTTTKGRQTTLHLTSGNVTLNTNQRTEMKKILFEWQEGEIRPRQLKINEDGSYVLHLTNMPPIVSSKSDFVNIYNTMFNDDAASGLAEMEQQRELYDQNIHLNPAPYNSDDEDSCLSDGDF